MTKQKTREANSRVIHAPTTNQLLRTSVSHTGLSLSCPTETYALPIEAGSPDKLSLILSLAILKTTRSKIICASWMSREVYSEVAGPRTMMSAMSVVRSRLAAIKLGGAQNSSKSVRNASPATMGCKTKTCS